MTANWLHSQISNSAIDDHAEENNFLYLDTLELDLIAEAFKTPWIWPILNAIIVSPARGLICVRSILRDENTSPFF
jgi:hypothetical protein